MRLAAGIETTVSRAETRWSGLKTRADSWVLVALTVAALTAVGAAIRLVILPDSVFADELSTYWVLHGRGLSGVVSTVHTDAEITPPLYFILAWLTTKIASSIEMLRLPSFIAGVAAIPLTYLLGLRTVGRWPGIIAAALTALSPFMIFYSTEARGYELMIVLVLCSTLALLAGVEQGRSRWWLLYTVSSCAAVYTHYTAVFGLAAQLLWVLWAYPHARRAALLANLAAILLFLPWLSGLIADLQSPTTKILAALEPFSLGTVRTSLARWSFGAPFSIIDISSLPGVPALILMTAGVLAAAVGLAGTAPGRAQVRALVRSRFTLVLALALAAPVGEALVSAVGSDVLGTRNLAVSWPGLALVAATLLVRAPQPYRLPSIALLLAAFTIAGVKMAQTGYQRPAVREATRLIDQQASPGDVVVDATRVTPGPLTAVDVYLSRPLRVVRAGVPQERDHPFGVFDPIVTARQAAKRAATVADGRRIFLVTATDRGAVTPNPLGAAVAHYLPAEYRLVKAQGYPGLLPMATLVFGKSPDSIRPEEDGGRG